MKQSTTDEMKALQKVHTDQQREQAERLEAVERMYAIEAEEFGTEEAEYNRHIRRLAATAPPLTPQQAEVLRRAGEASRRAQRHRTERT